MTPPGGVSDGAPRLGQWPLYALVVVAGLAHVALLREGHVWGDDFAMYIAHARNLATGVDYSATGYLYNPLVPNVGPRAYPPGYPALLAPLYRVVGLDLHAFKVLQVMLFMAWLVLAGLLVARDLGQRTALVIVALFAASPWFFGFTDSVGSDVAFAVGCLGVILVADGRARDRFDANAALLAFMIFAAASVRTVGIVLLAALLVTDLVQARRLRRGTAGVGLLAGAALVAEKAIMGGERSYLDQLTPGLARVVASNVREYAGALTTLWSADLWLRADKVLAIVLILLAAKGAMSRWRSITNHDAFTALYLGVILLWPSNQGGRFLVPLVPALALYVATALRDLVERAPILGLVRSGLVAVLLAFFALGHARAARGLLREGIGDPRFLQCTAFLAETSPANARVVFRKPRLLSLLSGRASSAYAIDQSQDGFWSYFTTLGATHLVVDNTWTSPDFDHKAKEYLRVVVAGRRDRLRVVFDNGAFQVYEISGVGGRNRQASPPATSSPSP